MNFIRGIPEPQPLKDRTVEADNIPKTIFEKLNSAIQDMKEAGFDQFWFYSSKNSLTGGMGCCFA
jgi:hypothetical protein